MDQDKHILEDLGKRIHSFRQAKNMTQVAFGALLDIDESYVRRIEKGRSYPSLQLLITIAREMEMSLEELFAGIEVT